MYTFYALSKKSATTLFSEQFIQEEASSAIYDIFPHGNKHQSYKTNRNKHQHNISYKYNNHHYEAIYHNIMTRECTRRHLCYFKYEVQSHKGTAKYHYL